MSSGLLTDHPRADPRPALQSQPLFELRCSNNAMHVHSCADSCALLINLLQYLTSAGDLHPPPRPPPIQSMLPDLPLITLIPGPLNNPPSILGLLGLPM